MLDLKCSVIYLAQVRHLLSLHLKILKPGVDGLPLAAARDNNSNHNNSFAFWFFIFMHLFIFLYLYFFFLFISEKNAKQCMYYYIFIKRWSDSKV